MIQDEAFIQHIQAHPDEEELRLIYADWLEERNDPRADFLRTEAELTALPKKDKRRAALRARLREMEKLIDPNWLAAIDRAPLENCDHVNFEFECPKKWQELKQTDESSIRFCDVCKENVYYCSTVNEARLHAAERHCVAVASRQERKKRDVEQPRQFLGRIAPRMSEQLRVGDLVSFRRAEHQFSRGIIESIDAPNKATVRVLVDHRTKLIEAEMDSMWAIPF